MLSAAYVTNVSLEVQSDLGQHHLTNWLQKKSADDKTLYLEQSIVYISGSHVIVSKHTTLIGITIKISIGLSSLSLPLLHSITFDVFLQIFSGH